MKTKLRAGDTQSVSYTGGAFNATWSVPWLLTFGDSLNAILAVVEPLRTIAEVTPDDVSGIKVVIEDVYDNYELANTDFDVLEVLTGTAPEPTPDEPELPLEGV